MYDNILLKSYMKDKRYADCIALLKKKIIAYLIKQLKFKDNSITFTTVSDLINLSDAYLGNSQIARSLQLALKQDNELEKLHYLLLIYEEYNIR